MTQNGETTNPAAAPEPSSGMGMDDVLYTLFRHKWLIVAFILLGAAGAFAYRAMRPPYFVSQAKINIPYIKESGPTGTGNESLHPSDNGPQSILNTEVEILRSLDVASNAAAAFGPEKILARRGGGDDVMSAAGMILSGTEVEMPQHTTVLTVAFRHPDRSVVQPVLNTLIEMYMQQSINVHEKTEVLDAYYKQRKEELQKQLEATGETLKRLKMQAGTLVPDDSKHSYQTRIDKLTTDLQEAQRELEERKALLSPAGQNKLTAGGAGDISPELMEQYTDVLARINSLKQSERQAIADGLKDAHPTLIRLHEQLDKLGKNKAALLKEHPVLGSLASGTGGTNSAGTGFAADMVDIKRLMTRVSVLETQLNVVQSNAVLLASLDPQIREIELQQMMDSTNLMNVAVELQSRRANENIGPGRALNISWLQRPTPAALDDKKLRKKLMTVFGGLAAAGFGLAFLIEMFLDRSIKRSIDVERHLKLPVFLAIPDTTWDSKPRLALPWRRKQLKHAEGQNGSSNGNSSLTVWEPVHHLQTYTRGLCERLMTHFEVNNLNLKKPKLVGVTGCGNGRSGVTTLASGLAAALSRTGTGNVLLVDMKNEQGVAHSFYNGKPGCGLSDVLEPENRAEAQVNDHLFVASMQEESSSETLKIAPTGFTHLMPKIKGSDYDYIIFDMPPVSATSATPRMTGYMDIVLLVLEAERTGQQTAARASTLMREARANVAAVLNKCRPYVPAMLGQEL
jgi:polysaccharide biosynthesis transport protein